MPEAICQTCGRTYHIPASRAGKTKFCSRACQSTGSFKICENCGKRFYASKCRSSARFCSTRCWTTSEESKSINRARLKEMHAKHLLSGALNGAWKGGVVPDSRKRLLTTEWKDIVKDVLGRDRSKCVWCGGSHRLSVHHITPWRLGGSDDLSNLETVCAYCHQTVEANRSVLLAIRDKCITCGFGAKACASSRCPLTPYRLGRMPRRYVSRRQGAQERLEKARAARGSKTASSEISDYELDNAF